MHRRIRNIRRYFLQKLSTQLAEAKRVIVVEELNMSGLLQDQRLARHIADMGWGEFRRMLEYKTGWYGSQLLTANRYYPSSKTCSCCGQVLEVLPLQVREWDCLACGAHHDRDVSAARNLFVLVGPRAAGCRQFGGKGGLWTSAELYKRSVAFGEVRGRKAGAGR